MPRNVSFHVAPRYTPGSPAMVDEETALRVASQEKETYEVAADGVYGEDFKTIASQKGLAGIVERREESRNGWNVTDLITGRKFRREDTRAKNILPGDRILEVKTGNEAYGPFKDHLPVTALAVAQLGGGDGRKTVVRWDNVVGISFYFAPNDIVKTERDAKEEP